MHHDQHGKAWTPCKWIPFSSTINSLQNKSCPRVHSKCICSSKILTIIWIGRPTVIAISENVKSLVNLRRRITSIKIKSRLFPIYNHLAKYKRNKFSLILCFCHQLSQDLLALFASYIVFVGFDLLVYSKLKRYQDCQIQNQIGIHRENF